jgi:hypothetical protein
VTPHAQLHAYILDAIDDIRQQFAAANMPEFRLDIECSGRTMGKDESKISYKLGTGIYSASSPSGSALTPVIEECVRRAEWDRRHDATALPAPAPSDDDIAF